MDELSYEEAILRSSMILDSGTVNSYQLSLILSYLFDHTKEKTLKDILEQRRVG